MSTLGNIYTSIKNRINTQLNWINSVDLYQQQDLFQEENLGFKPPVVFIDFQDIEYETTSKKVQQGTMNVVVKLVIEDYTKNYLKVFDKKELLNAKLNAWGEWGSDLERITETTDIDADSLYIFETTYSTVFWEETYTDDLTETGGTNGTWGFCLDLQIDAFNLPSPTSKIFGIDACLSEPVFIDYVSDITTNSPLSSSYIESRTGRSYTINIDDNLDYVATTGGTFLGDINFNSNVQFDSNVSFALESGSAGAVYNFDLDLGNIFIIDFPNATIVDYSNAQIGTYQFILQNQTTSSTISFSSNKWQRASEQTITLTATAGATDMLSCIFDGSKMLIVQTPNLIDI